MLAGGPLGAGQADPAVLLIHTTDSHLLIVKNNTHLLIHTYWFTTQSLRLIALGAGQADRAATRATNSL